MNFSSDSPILCFLRLNFCGATVRGHPSVRYAFFACFFISAISAFIVFISSASFSSPSSRVLAYTFLDMRLPLTLGVNRP